MKTATIERYRVYITSSLTTFNYCLALFYRGEELTPCEGISPALKQWIPADTAGVDQLRQIAKKQGFTHLRFEGEWPQVPKREKL